MPGMDLNAILRKDHDGETMGKGAIGLGKHFSNLSVKCCKQSPGYA